MISQEYPRKWAAMHYISRCAIRTQLRTVGYLTSSAGSTSRRCSHVAANPLYSLGPAPLLDNICYGVGGSPVKPGQVSPPALLGCCTIQRWSGRRGHRFHGHSTTSGPARPLFVPVHIYPAPQHVGITLRYSTGAERQFWHVRTLGYAAFWI
jgi:hypothetical protein